MTDVNNYGTESVVTPLESGDHSPVVTGPLTTIPPELACKPFVPLRRPNRTRPLEDTKLADELAAWDAATAAITEREE